MSSTTNTGQSTTTTNRLSLQHELYHDVFELPPYDNEDDPPPLPPPIVISSKVLCKTPVRKKQTQGISRYFVRDNYAFFF